MFSPSLGRAIRSTSIIPGSAACATSRPASVSAIGAASQALSQRSHQRRRSSSKTSIPPNGSDGSSSTQQTASSGAARNQPKKVTARANRRKPSPISTLNIPHVPPTTYLQKPDVEISSFFSLHRPISVTTAIPPVSTEAAFNSIFETRFLDHRNSMIENLQTLTNSVEGLEAAMRPQEERDIREEVLQNSASNGDQVKHLDSVPQVSVDQLIARLPPFRPPPAPVAPGAERVPSATIMKRGSQQSTNGEVVHRKQKTWSTTVVVTESTDASGQRTYSASTTPMVEIQVPTQKNEANEVEIRQPFLDRMKVRQGQYNRYRDERRNKGRINMILISVKRQRKLKMKKHKYKKLMKRTRLLRRKLDKL